MMENNKHKKKFAATPSTRKGGLQSYINSDYIDAANALRGNHVKRRIVAYVESYDDIYFWRTVLSQALFRSYVAFENQSDAWKEVSADEFSK